MIKRPMFMRPREGGYFYPQRTVRILLQVLLAILFGALPAVATSGWLVLRDGQVVETQGAWGKYRLDERYLIYQAPQNPNPSIIDASLVDIAKSIEATSSGRPPAPQVPAQLRAALLRPVNGREGGGVVLKSGRVVPCKGGGVVVVDTFGCMSPDGKLTSQVIEEVDRPRTEASLGKLLWFDLQDGALLPIAEPDVDKKQPDPKLMASLRAIQGRLSDQEEGRHAGNVLKQYEKERQARRQAEFAQALINVLTKLVEEVKDDLDRQESARARKIILP